MAIPTIRAVREASVNRYDRFNYNGLYALNLPNMAYRDPATGYVYELSNINSTNYTTLTSQYLLQRYGAKYFAGMLGAAKLATDAQDLNFPLAARGVYDMVCASGSNFNFGDMVAPATNGGNTALLSDTVIVTKDPALAVGVVVSESGATQYPSGTALVRCLMSTGLDSWFANGINGLKLGKLTETVVATSLTTSGTGPFSATYTFTQKLPAGALVLGTRCFTNTIFAGTSLSAATFIAGWTGHTNAFAAQSLDVFTGAVGNSALSTAAGPQVVSETAPILTFTLTGTGTLTGGNVTVSILYLPPEGP